MVDPTSQVMDLRERLKAARGLAETEEATKNAVVMPFLRMLGYDVFDPREVVPEFTADVGIKKGEKIDYAIRVGDEISMLIEVKKLGADLGKAQYSQLYRYFGVCKASVAILTNGSRFLFFTDIDQPNKMDEAPFFEFDLDDHRETDLDELARFHKSAFDIERIRSTAARLRHVGLATAYLKKQFAEPDEEFARLVARSFHEGSMTAKVLERIRPTVKLALAQMIRDRISERLKLAFESPTDAESPEAAPAAAEGKSEIETTEDEIQGFYIVKAIASAQVDPARVTIRDSKSYCAILLDDNNRKPLCRLHFNGRSRWFVGFFDEAKTEVRELVEGPADIYKFSDRVLEAVRRHAS